MKIYFAGSISGGREDAALYLQIVELLAEYGTVLTEHIGDNSLTASGEFIGDKAIHDRDIAWLREADVVVAEVTVPSLGVGYELGRAVEWNKRVLCLHRPSEAKRLSAMIAGAGNITAKEYAAVTDLREIFDAFFV